MNPQATELNEIIEKSNPEILDLLSERGKNIFFPKKGILGQTADAKTTKLNATIGAAYEDDGSPMRLYSIEKQINLAPKEVFPYAPSFGRPEIRAKWKKLIYKKNPALNDVELSLPVVCNALTHGLSILGYLFANEGEKIIIPDLYWGNYNLIFKNAYGTEFETFETFSNSGFNINALKNLLLDGKVGKKMLLLNFPNNPTGYTPTVEEVKNIVSIIKQSAEKGNKILVICDDAYFGLVYKDGIEKQSIFAYLANLHKNILAVKTDGPTKEDYVWGFRIGFITYGIKGGNKEVYTALENKTAGAVRGNISNSCNLSQSILLKAFENNTYWKEKEEKYAILKSRYDKIQEVLQNEKYKEVFTALPVNSGYFMCIKLKNGLNGEKIRKTLIEEYSTGIINFNNMFRLAFSCVAKDDIKTLFDNIYNACKKY